MLSNRFQDALSFAFELHRDQKRKGASGAPYIGHLLGVTGLVIEYGGDEDEAIAALLHDAVEDQGGAPTLQLIRERFGERVAEIVDGCSDTDQTPKPPWLERKQQYLAHLPQASPSVRLVSTADKLNNVRDILVGYRLEGEKLWARFKGGRNGTLWYYRTYANTARASFGTSPLLEELERAVSELEMLVNQRK